MNPETIIVTLLAQVPVYAGLWFTNRRLKPEVDGLKVDNTKDMADAGEKWLENYNRMFELLAKRDGDLLEVRRQLGEVTLELQLAKKKSELLEQERDYYKGRLEEFQRQADADRANFNHQLSDLRLEVDRLKGALPQNQS